MRANRIRRRFFFLFFEYDLEPQPAAAAAACDDADQQQLGEQHLQLVLVAVSILIAQLVVVVVVFFVVLYELQYRFSGKQWSYYYYYYLRLPPASAATASAASTACDPVSSLTAHLESVVRLVAHHGHNDDSQNAFVRRQADQADEAIRKRQDASVQSTTTTQLHNRSTNPSQRSIDDHHRLNSVVVERRP